MLSVFTVIEPELEVAIVSEAIVPLTETTCVVTGCGFSDAGFEDEFASFGPGQAVRMSM